MNDDDIADRMSKRVVQDAETAAIAYGATKGARSNPAQGFLDGATWMMQRIPSFIAEMKGSIAEDDVGHSGYKP